MITHARHYEKKKFLHNSLSRLSSRLMAAGTESNVEGCICKLMCN
jgi:hypothetical protein